MSIESNREFIEMARDMLERDERLDQIYAILRNSSMPLTAKQVARRAGVSKSWAWRLLNALQKSGDADKISRGVGYPIPVDFWFAYTSHDAEAEKAEYERAYNAVYPGSPKDCFVPPMEQTEFPF